MDGRSLLRLEPPPAFESFGPGRLAPRRVRRGGSLPYAGEPRAMRRSVRKHAPTAPGVYGMVDRDGELIYVGQSKSLRDRLVSYFGASAAEKARRIIARTATIHWETTADEFAALLRELELIRRWRPRYNVRGQPNRRQPCYLVLGRGPARYVYLAPAPGKGEATVFGPVRAGRRHRRAVRLLNDCFLLRTCGRRVPIGFADQGDLFDDRREAGCLRHELGTCLGPCAGVCSSGQYRDRVEAARRFLCGADRSILDRLQASMLAAAGDRHFEQAARLRDLWQALGNLDDQLQRLRDARRYNFLYPLAGRGGTTWYLLRHGHPVAALADARSPAQAARHIDRIERVYGGDSEPSGNQALEDPEIVRLVAGWFRSRPDEMSQTVAPEAAIERLRRLAVVS